jgi:hypothetical protein
VVVFLGHVYRWGKSYSGDSYTPVLIDSLKAYRAVQVRFLIAYFLVCKKIACCYLN